VLRNFAILFSEIVLQILLISFLLLLLFNLSQQELNNTGLALISIIILFIVCNWILIAYNAFSKILQRWRIKNSEVRKVKETPSNLANKSSLIDLNMDLNQNNSPDTTERKSVFVQPKKDLRRKASSKKSIFFRESTKFGDPESPASNRSMTPNVKTCWKVGRCERRPSFALEMIQNSDDSNYESNSSKKLTFSGQKSPGPLATSPKKYPHSPFKQSSFSQRRLLNNRQFKPPEMISFKTMTQLKKT
jgi:hypothetical protein